jgi:hypothetical protein
MAGPVGITREQFLRGIAAVQRYAELVRAVQAAMETHGIGGRIEDVGGEAVALELTRQLEERCNDPGGEHGSMIDYMLYDCGGPVVEADGRRFMVNTPELLWAYWEQTGNGPFEAAGEAA